MAETFLWGKTLLWIMGASALRKWISECVISRRRRLFQAAVASPNTRLTERTFISSRTFRGSPARQPIASGGNTPYYLSGLKRILLGEIIAKVAKLFR